MTRVCNSGETAGPAAAVPNPTPPKGWTRWNGPLAKVSLQSTLAGSPVQRWWDVSTLLEDLPWLLPLLVWAFVIRSLMFLLFGR